MEGVGGKGLDPRYALLARKLLGGSYIVKMNTEDRRMMLSIERFPISGIPVAWSTGLDRNHRKDPALIASQERFRSELRELIEERSEWKDFPLLATPRKDYFDTGAEVEFFFVYRHWDDYIKSPDVTNLQKSLEDALTGLIWKDDSPKYISGIASSVAYLPSIDCDTTFITIHAIFHPGKNGPPPDSPAPGGNQGDSPASGGGPTLWTPHMN